MMTIHVETLRTWLEEGKPVTVLDIRPIRERAEWAIPGSIHIDAYDALKARDPHALAHLALPEDMPVVTVSAAGKTGHSSAPVPFDGIPLAATLAEFDEQVEILNASKEAFLQQIMARIPATPPNYHQIVKLNEIGMLPESGVTDLEAGANRCAIS
jgi:Rhodanese-like domain